MEMTRISVPMTIEEREMLRRIAQQELRDPRDHARYIIRNALGLHVMDGAVGVQLDKTSTTTPTEALPAPSR